MFKKLLIANRGEIACRIIKTAKRLGIRTVAVYSDIDAQALHVQLADESYCLGAAPSADSYLNGEKIIRVAKQAQAEAIHPGYGFLSEDDEFAEQCQQAGLIFVGPSPQAIRQMGDKNLAKTTMIAAGVPVTPGYQGETTDLNTLKKEAKKIGLPVLIKASAGGGGKGMRLVHDLDKLGDAVQSAQREAQASFGDSRVFLEKYLTPARHIEVQILFDQHGHGVYLFDRDCSIQRRHQKVIEEAPAPNLKASTRKNMAETALRAGQAIQYAGAGTIEFLVDENEDFYFMEMNTRLQVEHPVTELITGLDLVEWQLRIAAGEKLTLKSTEIKSQGHAIEARLYAENPLNNFMPSAGMLHFFQLPAENKPAVRVDSGFQAGDRVSVYYDPLLAKLIAWGENRLAAIHRLQRMLNETAVVGIHTNWSLLNRIIANPDFIEAKISTHFITEHQTALLTKPAETPAAVIIMACFTVWRRQQSALQSLREQNEDTFSPWFIQDNWRINQPIPSIISFWQGEKHWVVPWDDHHHPALAQRIIFVDDDQIHIFCLGEQWSFSLTRPLTASQASQGEYDLQAPMPGTIVAIYVQPGQTVAAGDRLLVMEAMKMEHSLLAAHNGVIEAIFFKAGDRVNEGEPLLKITAGQFTPAIENDESAGEHAGGGA